MAGLGKWFAAAVALFGPVVAQAQALTPGDIAIVGLNADGDDVFAFVALAPIASGTQIRFTDNGWLAAGGFRTGEGQVLWVADATVGVGETVTIDPAAEAANTGVVTDLGGYNLAAGGDSLIAFQGTLAAPTALLAAVQQAGAWNADAATANTSALPTGLGAWATEIDPHADNATYDCAIAQGTPEFVRSLIADGSRWLTDDANPFVPATTCGFALSECGDGTCSAIESLEQCPGDCTTTDDFEDGVQGWVIGASQTGGNGSQQIADGGPDGAGDAYLQRTSDGSGTAGKLVVFNEQARWTGDWTQRRQITVMANSFGTGQLTLRPMLESGGLNRMVLVQGAALPNDGAWHEVVFDLTGAWSSNPDLVLDDVTKFRIIHNPDADTTPPNISATLGLDDITDAPPAGTCGDALVNDGELCDDTDFGFADCSHYGFTDPDGLACNLACDVIDTAGCAADCPDGNTEPGEDCDDGARSATCDEDCTVPEPDDGICNDLAGETPVNTPGDCPTACDDGYISGAEVCDLADLDGADCTDFGFSGAAGLACAVDCLSLDSSGCTNDCGDGVTEPGEDCDDDGESMDCDDDCTDVEVGDGVCNATAGETAATNETDCPAVCGDSTITHDEVCDATDFGSATCLSEGFDSGALACDACTALDTSGCAYDCGNDSADGTEVCDGTDLDGSDCTDFGFSSAAGLACDAGCDGFDSSGCAAVCGDENVEPGEECDDGDTDNGDGCDEDCQLEADSGDPDDTGEPDDTGDPDNGGCGCATGAASLGWWLLGLPLLARRRRWRRA